MHNLVMRLKSGREFKFSCKTYEFERYKFGGTLVRFKYTGGIGECPIYFDVDDIEAIIEITDENDEMGHIRSDK